MNIHSRSALAGCLLILAALLMPAIAVAQTATGVGFAPITIHDPVNGGMMPGYVFYPSTQAKGVSRRGPYELHASMNAKPVPGAKPLVVIAHGHGGADLGHHDLAVYLASHGFVTATLEFPKDNFHDMSGTGKAVVLVGRPIQVKATISMLLSSVRWKALVDPNQIGVAGFSAGGYTALMVVGAVPRFSRFIDYCELRPEDQEIGGVSRRIAASAHQTARAYAAAMQKDLDKWGNTDDPRVKAAFVMAPLSLLFDKAGLAHIDYPVSLYYGQDDHVLLPKYNVLHIAPLIKTLVGIRMIPKAGHYVFLTPCSPELTRDAPDICKDPPGVDRVAVHRQINASALAFFRKTLGVARH